MKGLAPQVSKIFEKVSCLDCIKPFTLVGGTALSIQLQNRQSEDLDFMRWKTSPSDKLEIGWPQIKKEIEKIGKIEDIDITGFDMAEFVVDGVKLSFYAAPRERISEMQEIQILNNLRVADIKSIGAMKMETMSRRSKFRDYYDIFSILKTGVDIGDLIPMAIKHSGYSLKTKNLLAILTNGERFTKDKMFEQLNPVYNVTATEIQDFIINAIETNRDKTILSNIDSQLKESASIYKSKKGETILRAKVDLQSFTIELTDSEKDKAMAKDSFREELAIQKFHDLAVKDIERRSKRTIHL